MQRNAVNTAFLFACNIIKIILEIYRKLCYTITINQANACGSAEADIK
jgi:hypothetical protein